MKTVAVIAEYNPFHLGHAYHFSKIREEFGENCAIIAIMSGNFTQRGEPAILPKSYRARMALECGANIVVELPFPFCSSSAEFFAKAGVSIADSLGCVDVLSFGSESGNIEELTRCAQVMLSENFRILLEKLGGDRTKGYPALCELAFKQLYPESNFTFTSNNILAIEYIKALISQNSTIQPHTVKRVGADYLETDAKDKKYPSAMSIRSSVAAGILPSSKQIPKPALDIFDEALKNSDAPTDINKLSSAIISYLRLNPPASAVNIHDATDGIYNRLCNASYKASDIFSLLDLAESKSYTNARMRRAVWNIFFGVTSSDVNTPPAYTQLLAADSVGFGLLKKSKGSESFTVLTKPSATHKLTAKAREQKFLCDKADMIYELMLPVPKSAKTVYTFTPFIKK